MLDSDMNGRVKIYVKYTLKDIWDFCITKVFGGLLRKILLIPFIILLALVSVFILVSFLLFSRDPELLLVLVPELLFLVLFCAVIEFLPFLFTYLVYRNNFKKSKALQTMQCFDVSKDYLVISTEESSAALTWDEIYRIQEFSRCFFIYQSSAKIFILPKRCFESQEQLEEFRSILYGSVQSKKLNLKNYSLKYSSPDYCDTEFAVKNIDSGKSVEENEDKEPEILLEVTLKKREYIKFNFIYYYTKPLGIVLTVIGLCLLVLGLMDIKKADSFVPSVACMLSLMFGVIFTLLFPIILFINSGRAYENDAIIKRPVLYKIYKDRYTVNESSNVQNVKWTKLVKVVVNKNAIFLFITTNIANIIPKRIFEGREEDLMKFENILKECCREKLRTRF